MSHPFFGPSLQPNVCYENMHSLFYHVRGVIFLRDFVGHLMPKCYIHNAGIAQLCCMLLLFINNMNNLRNRGVIGYQIGRKRDKI